jgi:Ni,Fe-hydrogenase I cytochrome b subunit
MKVRKVIEITTENYEEQSFILTKFPKAWWNVIGPNVVKFYLPLTNESDMHIVESVLQEWRDFNES